MRLSDQTVQLTGLKFWGNALLVLGVWGHLLFLLGVHVGKSDAAFSTNCLMTLRMYDVACIKRAPTGDYVLLDLAGSRVVPEGAVCLLDPGYPWRSVVICKDKRWQQPDLKMSSNSPPIIFCPGVNDVYTGRRETSTIVTWSEPSAWDLEDGNITVYQTGGNRSGSEFETGPHLVLFEAVDSGGLRVTCQIHFQVLVRRCPEMSVTNGYRECSHDNIYGSVCHFRCYPGFETTGETLAHPGPQTNGEMTASCESDQRWVGVASQGIVCEMIQCEQPDVRNGQLICPSVTYNSVCILSCDAGYNPIGQQQTWCLANKTWTPYGQCLDVQPPTISCLTTIEAPAGPKLGQAEVFWDRPDVSDNSGLETEVFSDVISGANFSVGTHVVTFTATDASKNRNTCKTLIVVKVIHCPEYTPAYNADVTCSHGDAYGSECVTTCHPGYQLRDVTERAQTCLLNQSWGDVKPVCRPRTCAAPPPVLHGQFYCPRGHEYKEKCHLQCNHGYQVTGRTSITCTVMVRWSQAGFCADVSAPYFPDGCNDQLKVEAASFGEPTYVIYQLPEVEDNSGMEVTVTGDPVSGSSFSLGTTEVTVTAVDQIGNNASCSFKVTVESVHCEPPNLDLSGRDLIVYNCEGRFVLGSTCLLTCANGNPILGSGSIRCERDATGNLTWKVFGDRPPFCEAAACGKLKPPRGGALVCDALSSGEMCALICDKKMSYPASASSFYRCIGSSGLWQPYEYVPDCKEASEYENVQIEAVFTYSTGACSNNTDVSGRFFNRLLASDLSRDCGHSGCNFTNVKVDCEPASENRLSAEYKIAVTIDLVRLPNKSHDAGLLDFYQSMANSIDDSLYHEEEKGTFRIPEIGQLEQFYSNGVNYLCLPGTKFIYTTMLCAGCGPGHMYDNTTNSCRVCPKDTYQDQDISFSCTPCPNNTVTQVEMATSGALCLDLCRPGQFSHNGIQPCVACPVGSYQSKYGMKSCDLCPYSMSTINNGTSVIDDCLFFNTRLSETTTQAAIQIFDKIPTTFTFMTWVTSASTLLTSSLTFSLESHKNNSTAAFLSMDKIVLAINEQRNIGGLKVIRKWHHVALTYKKGVVKFFLNGELVSERSGVRLSRLSQKYLVFQKSADVNAVVVSGLQLTTSFYTELQLREFATSCHKKVKTNLLARKPWEFLALSPSTCNDVNACQGEPCGQHGTCISGLDTLQCLCHTPWSGDRCQVALDFCADNLCANGATCVNMPKKRTYKCICAPNFMGKWCTKLRRQKNQVRQNEGMA